ncbi:MAG: winged helix-turn-helix transcriptional regulator [Faecousia sp.]
MIHREVYPVISPKVECSPAETGRSLMPVLVSPWDWGAEYLRRKTRNTVFYDRNQTYRQSNKRIGELL